MGRTDILKKREEAIRAEAPCVFKDIEEVLAVHTVHDMAGPAGTDFYNSKLKEG